MVGALLFRLRTEFSQPHTWPWNKRAVMILALAMVSLRSEISKCASTITQCS